MRILLINPPSRNGRREDIAVPPLGLAYLAACLEQKGHEVKILDALARGLGWTDFAAEIAKEKADLTGIGGLSPIFDGTLRAARVCRPHTRYIVLGGPHVTVQGEQIFRECPEADFGIQGEGEGSFLSLVDLLEKGKDPGDLPGMILPGKANPPGEFISDLDRLPFPARHLLPNESYRYALWPGKKITTMITSRGCPYACLFCEKSIFGSRWRARSPQNVLAEMELIVRDLKIRSIVIYDDLFTLERERAIRICQGILERGLKVEWKCEGRVDRVDGEMLRWMKRAGCSLIAYGVESGNQAGLDYLRKGTNLDQIRRAFRLTREAGIRPMAYFILGIPVETYEQSRNTIRFARELNPDYAQFSILSPYPGTRLYEEVRAKGWYGEVQAHNPFDRDRRRPVVLNEHWSEERLNKILRRAHRAFYLRPGYICRHLFGLRGWRQLTALGGMGWGLLRWYFSREGGGHAPP